jgi:uncharacterized protein YkwD
VRAWLGGCLAVCWLAGPACATAGEGTKELDAAPAALEAPASGQDAAPPSLEEELLAEVNRLRADPPAWAGNLRWYRSLFDGQLVRAPGEIALQTQEGPGAVDEAIRFLERAEPLPPLRRSPGMSRAAAEHAADLGESGQTGHLGADGSQAWDRLSRHGKWKKTSGEVVSFGQRAARRVVIQFLVDDGVPDRGHRKNLFDPGFAVAGVACGPHARYGHCCVITLAGDYEEARGTH